ncbi:uncharacterized protein DMAD_11120 [Drosophila madeirensis]|uniref:Uncharacterized protein n=1 Tax=Drosophila madeirensis TaxID=30013 RepID=A0AAU9FC00_DROMD
MGSEIQYRMDMVSHEIRLMRNTLENYRHHMAQINEDIADIYLIMYQINIRFEKDDRRRYKSSKKERVRLTEKVEEASEVPVKASAMHVETSEIPAELQPQWEDPSKPSTSVNPRHQGRQSESVEVLIKHSPCETQMESHAKRQFLKNMLLHKKSEVTIYLNRHNVYFPELLRVLNDIKELEETTTSILSSETELQ